MGSYDFVSGTYTYYSKSLINGIASGYAAISNHEDKFVYLHGVKARIQNNIQVVLEGANWKLWATLNHVMSLLAEAAQEKYLELL